MKTCIAGILALFVLIFMNACAVPRIDWTKEDQRFKLGEKYEGVYVFNKQLLDEMLKREKEREEYRENYFKQEDDEKEKFLRTIYTEKDIKKIKESHIVTSEMEEFSRKYDKTHPYLIDEKYPTILSNGCKYFNKTLNVYAYHDEFKTFIDKVKKYLGVSDEDFEILWSSFSVESYYQCGKERIPLTFQIYPYDKTYIYLDIYSLGGDEGAGFYFDKTEFPLIYKGSKDDIYIYYFIDGKFVKSNKKVKYWKRLTLNEIN
ncbi:hypothetical protein [Campylobacter sp. 2457A]|uniref:hypothetical protein n=1 Tax=Campylobacter sp. 2457A TaxID=2735784 RepID=UPI00301E1C66|nr:hypothetical protein [Campylobacter sp. 2457A]